MKHPAETVQAPARLDQLRAEVAGGDLAHLAELAGELLQFSQALDRHWDFARAFETAQEGIVALERAAYAEDPEMTILMDALVAQYLSISHRSRMTPDRKLLAPIATALAHAVQP